MSGILDWLGLGDDSSSGTGLPASAASQTVNGTGIPYMDAGAAPLAAGPAAPSGFSAWLNGTPQAANQFRPSVTRIGLIGAGLQDAGATVKGQQGGYLQNMLAQNRGMNVRNAVYANIKAAYATGDRNQINQALLTADQYGIPIGGATDAMNYGNPVIKDYRGNGGVAGFDPRTGQPVSNFQAPPSAPLGYRYDGNGNLQYIPGGPANPSQAGSLAGASRVPTPANPNATLGVLVPQTGGGPF
ncbi:MAG: hypothetical protein WCA81_11345 [Rhizomicrobium sp.]